MKDREGLNTTVNTELKKFFEDTKGLHNMSFGEFLDKSIRELALNFNQTTFIDQEIIRKDNEISRLQQEKNQLIELKSRISQLIPLVEHKENGNSAEFEKLRNELFEKSKDSILKLWNKSDINWDSVVPKYKFQDRNEAREWFSKKIAEMI